LPQPEICGLEVPSIDGSGTLRHLSSRCGGRLLRSPFVLNPSALYVATVPHIHTHDFPWSDKQRHLNAKAIVKGCVFPGAILL
jgi:hypothetical protein